MLGLMLLAPAAQADTYIKGTQASYHLEMDSKKANISNVFVDEANDTNNKNYAQFACEDGAAIFYLNSSQRLYNQKQYDDESTPDMQVSVDGGRPINMVTVTTDTDKKPNFYSLAVDDKFDAQMLRLFQSAQKSIVISFPLPDKKTAKFTFYPKGFTQAFSKINMCQ